MACCAAALSGATGSIDALQGTTDPTNLADTADVANRSPAGCGGGDGIGPPPSAATATSAGSGSGEPPRSAGGSFIAAAAGTGSSAAGGGEGSGNGAPPLPGAAHVAATNGATARGAQAADTLPGSNGLSHLVKTANGVGGGGSGGGGGGGGGGGSGGGGGAPAGGGAGRGGRRARGLRLLLDAAVGATVLTALLAAAAHYAGALRRGAAAALRRLRGAGAGHGGAQEGRQATPRERLAAALAQQAALRRVPMGAAALWQHCTAQRLDALQRLRAACCPAEGGRWRLRMRGRPPCGAATGRRRCMGPCEMPMREVMTHPLLLLLDIRRRARARTRGAGRTCRR